MQVLRSARTSHDEMAAALGSFRLNRRAHELMRRTDAEMLCTLLASPHRDVRVKAAGLLGELRPSNAVGDELETRALIGYARTKQGTGEYVSAIAAIGNLAIVSAPARLFLLAECERLLRKPSVDRVEARNLHQLLLRLNTFDGDAPESLIRSLKTLARNHQLEAGIRKYALQAIALLGPADDTTIEWIVQTMANPPAGTGADVPTSVFMFVGRCRDRLDYLFDIHACLPRLQQAILDYYSRFMSVTPEYAESVIYDLRMALEGVHHMMNSYEELAKRLPP
jgi:hypothetical protein